MVFQSVNYPIGISRFFMVSLSRFESFIPDGKRLYLNGGQSPHVNVEKKTQGILSLGSHPKVDGFQQQEKCRKNVDIMGV